MNAGPSARSTRAALTLLAALLIGLTGSGAEGVARGVHPQGRQDQRATFKSDVTYVEIPAVVVDREGRFVKGLRESDFEIYEEGVRQVISTFRLVEFDAGQPDVGSAAVEGRPLESDVQTNATPFDGRLYVLLVDDLHIDPVSTLPTRELATRFINTQVGPRDLAAVIPSSGQADACQDFTANRQLLIAAIDRFLGRGLALAPELGVSDRNLQKTHRRTTLAAIRAISNELGAIRGRRKAVVLFSEGVGPSGTEGRGDPSAGADADVIAAIVAANRANVSIYSVDPGGLKLMGGRADIAGGVDAGSDPFVTGVAGLDALTQGQLDVLRYLSLTTGGLIAANTNNLRPALDRIGEDSTRYYLLGYYPATAKGDGSFRRLEVKVGVPGVAVRARSGYFASNATASPRASSVRRTSNGSALPAAIQEAFDYPLPVSGIRLAASAVPFRIDGGKASVTVVVQVDGRDISFSEVKGRFESRVALAMLASDAGGRVRNSVTRTFSLPLSADAHRQVVENGIRVVEDLELPDGRYRLRIAALDMASERVGSVDCDIDVPAFAVLPLAMSGVMLTSTRAGMVPNAGSARLETIRRFLPGPPTVSRVFLRGEVLGLVAEVYLRNRTAFAVGVVATVKDTEGREVYRHEDRRTAAQMAAGNGAFSFSAMVALATFAPGHYLLTVETRSELNPELRARRDMPFEVKDESVRPK